MREFRSSGATYGYKRPSDSKRPRGSKRPSGGERPKGLDDLS